MKILTYTLAVLGLVAGGLAQPAHADATDDADFSSFVSVQNREFYPRVKDGFKDKAVLKLDSEDYADLTAVVYSPNDQAIREVKVRYVYDWEWDYGWWEAAWDGKKDNGKVAGLATYQLVLSGTVSKYVDGDWIDEPVSTSRNLTLKSGYLNRHLRLERRGTATSSRAKGRGCYIDRYQSTLELACWRGSYAQATWQFKIPTNATKIRKALYGPSGYNHGGKLIMTGKRVGKTSFVVTAKVTKWRSEYFDSVAVRYFSRVRV